MTYNQLIEFFKEFARDHSQIETFGYGSISDIEVPVNPTTGVATSRDYPYIFFNPTNYTLAKSSITYRFNVIVMELTTEQTITGFSGLDSVITAQSNSLQILMDFLAYLQYKPDFKGDVIRSTSITPFKERFQDTVAGVTGVVEFQLPLPISFCDTPTQPTPTLGPWTLETGIWLNGETTWIPEGIWNTTE